MRKGVIIGIITITLTCGILLGLSVNAIAQEDSIPSWVKNTALWWAQGQISNAEYLKSVQWLVDNGLIKLPTQTSSMSTSSDIQSNPKQTSVDPLSITSRYDGQDALDKLKLITNTATNLSSNDQTERIDRPSSESQYALAIIFVGTWQGSISDGSSITTINGESPSIIPFQCQHVVGYIYNMDIQKQTENGQLTLYILKNGIPIDGGLTTSPYGVVALSGDCDNPDVVDNLKKIHN